MGAGGEQGHWPEEGCRAMSRTPCRVLEVAEASSCARSGLRGGFACAMSALPALIRCTALCRFGAMCLPKETAAAKPLQLPGCVVFDVGRLAASRSMCFACVV